jgi:hypothetical protein
MFLVTEGFGQDVAHVITQGFYIGVVVAPPAPASLLTQGFGSLSGYSIVVTEGFRSGAAVEPEPEVVRRTGGISNRKPGKRPPFWWEQKKPEEIELPYREPERAPEPVPFHATPDISAELAALDARIGAEVAEESRKKVKRMKRIALLASLLDE